MKKLWGLRHLRYFVLRRRLLCWFESLPESLGLHISESDWKYLDDVWKGDK